MSGSGDWPVHLERGDRRLGEKRKRFGVRVREETLMDKV